MNQEDLDNLRVLADDLRQAYPLTMEVVDTMCDEVERLTKREQVLRKLVEDFLAADSRPAELSRASNELIERARKEIGYAGSNQTTTPVEGAIPSAGSPC
jgi:hypothetical protein